MLNLRCLVGFPRETSAMAFLLCAAALTLLAQTPATTQNAPGGTAAPPAAGQASPGQAAPARPAPTPEQLAIQAASEKERQREMDLLGIKTLRPGASGDNKAPDHANYDESKADLYPKLPDPLVLNDGKPVTTAKMWWTERRPQIVELFDREILGRVPANVPKVAWRVVSTTPEKNGGVDVITKHVIGHVDNSADAAITVDIDLTVSTPANATGPVPVIMEFGFSRELMEAMARRFPPPAAGAAPSGPTWQQQVLARGWGYAEYVPTSVQPDNGAGLMEGIIGLANKGQPRKLDDWGVLRAWAWGASRALDYFATDPAVNAKEVGIEGHSRYGKAALVTMAYDPRFAIAYVSSSGEAGAKLYRHIFGEDIGNIAAMSEFHWMAGNFLKYDGPLTIADLPVDAHELIALCAPRPVFISGGAADHGDGWVDAKGMFMAAAAAGPVYRLLGKKDMGTTEFPPMETALIDGDIAFRQHSAGHTPGPNWPTFITFASRYIQAPGTNSSAH
jgi:(4-O-methyl)-D-glucuronate---lignin esterase